MFNRKPKPQPEPSLLDEVITDALSVLNDHVAGSPEYGLALDHVTKLHALQKDPIPEKRLSPDTLAVVLGNLAGIVLIVGKERADVITSKGLNFVLKAVT